MPRDDNIDRELSHDDIVKADATSKAAASRSARRPRAPTRNEICCFYIAVEATAVIAMITMNEAQSVPCLRPRLLSKICGRPNNRRRLAPREISLVCGRIEIMFH